MTTNRIKHFISLAESNGTRELDPIRQLLDAQRVEVSALHPVELWVDREQLIRDVEASILAIRNNRNDEETEVTRQYHDALVQQRLDFLDELRSDPSPQVFIAVYTVDSDAQILEDLGIDETDEPPPDVLPGPGVLPIC